MTHKSKTLILGSGISGVGVAKLAQKKGFRYFSFGLKKY